MSSARSPRACEGFSLLEILVAFSILALSLAVIMRVFSSSLRAQSLGDAYASALAVAENRLAMMHAQPVLHEGTKEGVGPSPYRWRTVTSIPEWWAGSSTTVGSIRPYQVKVTVHWRSIRGTQRQVSLQTLWLKAAP